MEKRGSKVKGKKEKKGSKTAFSLTNQLKKFLRGAFAPLHPPKYAYKTISNKKLETIQKKKKKIVCETLTPPTKPVAGTKRTLELLKICKKA